MKPLKAMKSSDITFSTSWSSPKFIKTNSNGLVSSSFGFFGANGLLTELIVPVERNLSVRDILLNNPELEACWIMLLARPKVWFRRTGATPLGLVAPSNLPWPPWNEADDGRSDELGLSCLLVLAVDVAEELVALTSSFATFDCVPFPASSANK